MSAGRSKKKPRGARGAAPRVSLFKGDWLDVMDSDGVWNVARVLSVPSEDEVEVKYDGWGEEYDEVVRLDSGRVAPFHTYTWAVKCWVRYLNWPLWPSVITIRTPGNLKGVEHLRREDRLLVDFFDNTVFSDRDRCWNQKKNVREFDRNFDEHRRHTNGDLFERSLALCLQSNATKKMPKFVKGTLPSQYATSVTESVDEMRRSMGNELWIRSFGDNRDRHFLTHVYEDIGREQRDDDLETDSPHIGEEALEIVYNSEDSEEEVPLKKKPSPKVGRSKKSMSSPKRELEAPPQPQTPTNHPKFVVMKDDIIFVDDDDDEDTDHRPRRHSKRPRQQSTPRSRRTNIPASRHVSPSTASVPLPTIKTPTRHSHVDITDVLPDDNSCPDADFLSSPPRPTHSPAGKPLPPPHINVTESIPDDSFQPEQVYTPPPRLKPSRHKAESKKQSKESSQHRRLPAKEVSTKTRDELSGVDNVSGHKKAWMTMISTVAEADAKDSRDVISNNSPAKNPTNKKSRQQQARESVDLDSIAVGDSENSFISPDLNGTDNGIEVGASEPSSVPLSPPPKKRKTEERSPKIKKSGSPRSVVGQYNVMDLDALESSGVKQVNANKSKPSSKISTAKSSTKRSVLDQQIAAAQKAIAQLMQDDDDKTKSATRKNRVKKTSPSANGGAARRTPAKVNKPPALSTHADPPAPLWSRSSHLPDETCPAVIDFSPPAIPAMDEISVDSSEEEESKSSTTPISVKRKIRSPPPDTISASASAPDAAFTTVTESSVVLTEANFSPSIVAESAVSTSPEKKADAKEIVNLEPQHRFRMMRVGERVGSFLDDMTVPGERLLVSAPRRFPEQENPKGQDVDTAAGAFDGVSNSEAFVSPATISATSVRGQAPGSVFTSSSGFSINSWFKRNLYATFLKPA